MSNEKTKLTKTFVDSLPLSPNKQVFYRDSALIGFALRVTSSKTYIAEKRIGDGRSSVRVTIGHHGDLTPTQARDQARVLLTKMALGINPNNEKKVEKLKKIADYATTDAQPTLLDAYTAYKNERDLSDKTLKDYDQCVDDYFIDWQNIKLIHISKKMVQEKHSELTVRSKARANLAMRFLRAVFNFSMEHYLDFEGHNIIDVSNPVKTLNAKKAWNKVRHRKGYIRTDQLHDWVNTVVTTHWVGQDYYNHNAYTNQDFLLTVLLTGFRREEAESLEWSHIDLKYGSITSVDPKNGESLTLPMGPILHYIMSRRFDRSGGKPYVFHARQGEGHVTNRSKARYRITELSGIEFTYHDLRRTFSSIAHSINVGAYTMKRLINHTTEDSKSDVTEGYIQVSFEDMKYAMCKIENIIFNDEHIKKIKARDFKTPTRHQDYLEKALSEKVDIRDPLNAISLIDQLKDAMSKKTKHT